MVVAIKDRINNKTVRLEHEEMLPGNCVVHNNWSLATAYVELWSAKHMIHKKFSARGKGTVQSAKAMKKAAAEAILRLRVPFDFDPAARIRALRRPIG